MCSNRWGETMIEMQRGCGYRQVGGLYMRGSGIAVGCDRLPYVLKYCPVCGSGIKFTRGYQMIDWYKYTGVHEDCGCRKYCPVCYPQEEVTHALMWVGDKHYDPDGFIDEAQKQGICKRINAVPRDIIFGETWILLAHKKAGSVRNEDGEFEPAPAIFYAFRPTHVEKILSKKQARDEKLIEKLRRQNIKVLIATNVDKDGNVLETEELPENKDKLGFMEALL